MLKEGLGGPVILVVIKKQIKLVIVLTQWESRKERARKLLPFVVDEFVVKEREGAPLHLLYLV